MREELENLLEEMEDAIRVLRLRLDRGLITEKEQLAVEITLYNAVALVWECCA